MRIFVLPVNRTLQPHKQSIEYPVGNDDYGVEQDFLKYLQDNSISTNNPDDAEWHYLPVFWTRWHLNHNYGRNGLDQLHKYTESAIIDSNKTFTICQYADGPLIDLGSVVMFYTSRKTKRGFDIPLLRNKLKTPIIKPRKRYLASFVGRYDTHPIRMKMRSSLSNLKGIYIDEGDGKQESYVDIMLRSRVALCPRGHGGSSFRFYEAMQLGVVPLLISDIDTRPFKDYIDWNSMSFFVKDPQEIPKLLKNTNNAKLRKMGKLAKMTYRNQLTYGKWCKYAIKELEANS